MTDFKPFDATTVDLQNSNLIEASAGTGKTYSIAILVLRLVLEKKLSVKEILMVTFTKAAVAELEERVRLFIRSAYKASIGETITDPTIAGLVSRCIRQSSQEEVEQHLRDAVLFLDETAVLTIHSFCQLTLTEFAFETNQLFGAETLPDDESIISEEVNRFWRENITTIPAELLKYVIQAKLSRKSIRNIVKEHLTGKKYYNYEKDKTYSFCEEDHQKIIAELKEVKEKQDYLTKNIHDYIRNNEQRIRTISEKNRHTNKAGLHSYQTPEQLIKDIQRIRKKGDPAYIRDVYADILTHCDDCEAAGSEVQNRIRQVIADINCQAINIVAAGIEEYKQRNNLLSFDDMIVNLHKAFTERENRQLAESLQQKYKAVFVDEFQDTDRLQYEIFEKAFGTRSILFYIGDPKQSIYAFRKADIFTYFKAKNDVQHRYTMNRNFRSSENLIAAMNIFFEPHPGFDTFHFKDAPDAISYRAVQSPEPNTKGSLYKGGSAVVPVTICEVPGKKEIIQTVTAQVIDLLSGQAYKIIRDGKEKNITPSDIGILVRTKKEGNDIKSALSRYGIPAITIDDAKVLQSTEALWLLYLLQAMSGISRSNINKALLSPFTGYRAEQILRLDDEKTLGLFRNYRSRWLNDGVFTALTQFIKDFNVRHVLLDPNTESGERIISNLFQLIELVHKVQTNKQLSPPELVSWLSRGIEGMETEGDEYEQRVESDEESVKIVTIHKSKGLEYKIVFAPFLDLVEREEKDFYSYRHPHTGEYVSIENEKISRDQRLLINEQIEQENRRLLYVALTRAVYKCFVHHSTQQKRSTLAHFLDALSETDGALIKKENAPPFEERYRYNPEDDATPRVKNAPVHFQLQHNSWIRMSYTMLAHKGEATSRPRSGNQADRYNQFMFSQLARGSKTGNMLHYIFEHVHFTDKGSWKYTIEKALKQYMPQHTEQYPVMLYLMLQHTFNVPLEVNGQTFRLSEVLHNERIHELEFDFPVQQYNPAALNRLTTAGIDVRISRDELLEGIMNGKMDLFFGCRGMYYILDWKSNYLGDTIGDYSPEALARAMNENNYHLQYLIYTLAAKKYLTGRLKNFDYSEHFGGVIYLFVRGVRNTGNSGIYINRPTLQQLDLLEEIMKGNIKEDAINPKNAGKTTVQKLP